MRDAGSAQRLEYGHARPDGDRRTLSILQAQLSAAGGAARAQRAHRKQHDQQQREARRTEICPVQHPVDHVEGQACLSGHTVEQPSSVARRTTCMPPET